MDPKSWIAFLTVLALEIALAIDNIIFLLILSSRLPVVRQGRTGVLQAQGSPLIRMWL